MGGNNLGEYLRARRAQLQPEHVGLHANARRRVKGLRREEVAMLAGISAEYYLRLEQGRDLHPSDQVLDSLARALHLDSDATAYLHTIAKPRTVPTRRSRPETVSPHIVSLIDGWPHTAAYVQGHSFTVLASNRLAAALSPHFAKGANPFRAAFLSPDMRVLYRDWEAMTAKAVPFLRSVVAGHEDDPRVTELVGELSIRSERFRTLWAKHDVKVRDEGVTQLDHPQVGPIDLRFQKFVLPESEHLLVTYHAEPGGPSDAAFRMLAAFAGDPDAP
ncbi:MAG: helix-turn-helix domain-containing protein [Mycobacterium sp.]|nr:helix-turn-helix domain-containing protein [Mycobacterium sp.]